MISYLKITKYPLKDFLLSIFFFIISYKIYFHTYLPDNEFKSVMIFIADISLILFLRSIFFVIYFLLRVKLYGKNLNFIIQKNSYIFFALALFFLLLIILNLSYSYNKYISKFSYLFYYSYSLGIIFYYFQSRDFNK